MSLLDPLTPGGLTITRHTGISSSFFFFFLLSFKFFFFFPIRRETAANFPPASLCSAHNDHYKAAAVAKTCAHLMEKLGQNVLWREHSHNSPGLSGWTWGEASAVKYFGIPLYIPRGAGGTCICKVAKGLQFNSIFPGNTCAVKELQLYVASDGETLATCLTSTALHTNEV